MKIPDGAVAYLKQKADHKFARIHPEDAFVYNQGLEDGVAIAAREILDLLKPEEPEKESE